MPIIPRRIQPFTPPRDVEMNYDGFAGGWNNIFRPTEVKPNELVQADNIMLVGKGVATGRWGSDNYFLAGTGEVRLLDRFYNPTTGVNKLLAITDAGYLVEKNGASYTMITGASFASGYRAYMTQLGGNGYIASNQKPFTRFNGSTLDVYNAISTPTSVTATNLSGASGYTTWSWRVSALSNVGETLASSGVSLSNLPLDLTLTTVRVSWAAVSAASGVLTGYNIYRGTSGNETYIASVGNTSTSFLDVGNPQSDTVFPQTSNTTQGATAKYILKFDDRLVLAGIDGDPTLVLISGRYPYQDRFHWADGGGYIRINPDGGDQITGLGIAGSQTQGGSVPAAVLVFMEHSTHQLILSNVTLGNYAILDPQVQQLAPTGATSHSTVQIIGNNTFYFGREGLFTIGSEASYLNQLRTKEISARVRSYVQNLSDTDFRTACAGVMDYKYLLSFPNRNETIVYDYERACFLGPWKTPWGITAWYKYFDSTGDEKWIAGTDTGYVKYFDSALTSDSGEPVVKILRTKKEDFKNWSLMKVIKTLYVMFRNIKGSVDINIYLEERGGTTIASKSFNITGSFGVAGWGIDQWGSVQFGDSDAVVALTGEEIIRWTQLFKTARVMQVEVISTGANDNWEFLGTKATAQPMPEGGLSSSTRV